MEYYGIVTENIRKELKEYIQKSGLKALVLGISGGIDSTICAALARPVCNELGIPLIGRSLTIESNKQDEIDRSVMVGNVLCSDFKYVDLTDLHRCMITGLEQYDDVEEMIPFKIRLGNVKARTRMIYLYDVAQHNRGMVLSTDNYTELLLGFWTLHGDVGDYGMVQNLWKTEVYELSKWIAKNEYGEGSEGFNAIMSCVDAIPTDGLGITSSDVEQLGAKNYDEVDALLQRYLYLNDEYSKCMGTARSYELRQLLTEISEHTVIKRMFATKFKRENPLNLSRQTILRGAIQ